MIAELLDSPGLAVLFGDSATYKSFIALDLGMKVAGGEPWGDRAVEQGRVVYIAAEAPGSIEKRIAAYNRSKTYRPGLNFYIMRNERPMLNDASDMATLTSELAEKSPSLVIIDSLGAAIDGDENGNGICDAVSFLGDLSRRLGCLVLVIQAARGNRPRGHSSLSAACDTQMFVSRRGKFIARLEVTKQRNGGSRIAFDVHLKVVRGGKNVSTLRVAEIYNVSVPV